MTTRRCNQCGEMYSKPPSQIGKYCSRRCLYAAQRKERTTRRRIRLAHGHPLAGKTGLVSEARFVLFEKIGWGPHECHWCGKPIMWEVGRNNGGAATLVADHLDHDFLNDDADNLVAACSPCNTGRHGYRIGSDELSVPSGGGFRTRAVMRRCETCDQEFLARASEVKLGKGRFCSRSCARRQPRR